MWPSVVPLAEDTKSKPPPKAGVSGLPVLSVCVTFTAAWLIVTLLVAPATVLIIVPPAISTTPPSVIVCALPVSASKSQVYVFITSFSFCTGAYDKVFVPVVPESTVISLNHIWSVKAIWFTEVEPKAVADNIALSAPK